MVFKISLPDSCFTEADLTTAGANKDSLAEQKLGQSTRQILGCLPDLRMKALQKFAEAADTFLAKLRNLFFSQQSFL